MRIFSSLAARLRQRRMQAFERPFRRLTLQDRPLVERLCARDSGISCHLNFQTMFFYQEMYDDCFRFVDACILKKPAADGTTLYIQYPIGAPEDRCRAIRRIVSVYAKDYHRIIFCAASDTEVDELRSLFPERDVNAENCRDCQQYMLDLEEQSRMEGSKFSDRRNKLRRFQKEYRWQKEPLTAENLEACKALNQLWYQSHVKSDSVDGEQRALENAFGYYDVCGFDGFVIRIDGEIAAFTMGLPFNDRIYMSFFTKQRNDVRNLSWLVEQEIINEKCRQYQYLNYSDDMGVPGLRKHKTMMGPAFMTPYYNITLYTQRKKEKERRTNESNPV